MLLNRSISFFVAGLILSVVPSATGIKNRAQDTSQESQVRLSFLPPGQHTNAISVVATGRIFRRDQWLNSGTTTETMTDIERFTVRAIRANRSAELSEILPLWKPSERDAQAKRLSGSGILPRMKSYYSEFAEYRCVSYIRYGDYMI